MKYEGTVIISDLDGTLLGEDRRIACENLRALCEFTGKGGLFGVATGRMELTTLNSFPELPINIPSIFNNGALICDLKKNRIVVENLMPAGLQGFLQSLLDRFPEAGMEINAKGKAFLIRSNDILKDQLEREGLAGIEAGWEEVPKGWYKVLIGARHEYLELVKEVIDRSGRKNICVVFSEPCLLDIMARGVSKGKALEYLRGVYGWRRVVAIGDSENDISLIKSADIGIAVANAACEVREAAGHIVGPNSVPCIPAVLDIIDGVPR